MTVKSKVYRVLAVDDEGGILNALQRQLRKTDYELTVASSGKEGLELLRAGKYELVISDMRMPEMSGAEFLAAVKAEFPDTVRILLTGYSDMDSTVRAINEGGIFSYLAKPWEREELLGLLERAAAHYQTRRNKQIKLVKMSRKALELKETARELEGKLEQSQQEVRQSSAFVDMAKREVEEAYDTAVEVFSNLIDLRIPGELGINREVAQVASFLATTMGLPVEEQRNIRLAGMLYNVGKIGLPREVLAKPYDYLAGQEKEAFHRYPKMGETALMALTPLLSVVHLIVLHRECQDGSGFPMGLSHQALPIGARILGVAVAFREYVKGRRDGAEHSESEAIAWLRQHGRQYDPDAVHQLALLVSDGQSCHQAEELQSVETYALQPGMRLGRDLYAKNGMLLLSQGHRLTPVLVSKLVSMDSQLAEEILIIREDTLEAG